MKEIRGGLPEKDANRGFWGVSTFFLIVLVLFGFCYVEKEQESVKLL